MLNHTSRRWNETPTVNDDVDFSDEAVTKNHKANAANTRIGSLAEEGIPAMCE